MTLKSQLFPRHRRRQLKSASAKTAHRRRKHHIQLNWSTKQNISAVNCNIEFDFAAFPLLACQQCSREQFSCISRRPSRERDAWPVKVRSIINGAQEMTGLRVLSTVGCRCAWRYYGSSMSKNHIIHADRGNFIDANWHLVWKSLY